MVPPRKQGTHQLSGTKRDLSGHKGVSGPLLYTIVILATDNTTVVAYTNKQGDHVGSLCALLWRIPTWSTRRQVTQSRARHIPGQLNVIPDKLSRLGQTIQTE